MHAADSGLVAQPVAAASASAARTFALLRDVTSAPVYGTTDRQLLAALRSGVLLRAYASCLFPGALPRQPGRRVSLDNRFLALDSIARFVDVARTVGVRAQLLFAPADLLSGKELGRVHDCLLEMRSLARAAQLEALSTLAPAHSSRSDSPSATHALGAPLPPSAATFARATTAAAVGGRVPPLAASSFDARAARPSSRRSLEGGQAGDAIEVEARALSSARSLFAQLGPIAAQSVAAPIGAARVRPVAEEVAAAGAGGARGAAGALKVAAATAVAAAAEAGGDAGHAENGHAENGRAGDGAPLPQRPPSAPSGAPSPVGGSAPVSYTHLTLPTKRIV